MTRAARRRALLPVLALALFAPAAAADIRFAVLADTHIGAGGAADGLRSIVEAVNADARIGFVVVAGDVTEKGRDGEFAEARSILAGLKAPVRVLPGNHDLHWEGFGGAGFAAAFGADRFAFEAGGLAFIGLNTWDFGHVAPPDLAWLERSVRGLPADRRIVLFVHFPPEGVDNWPRVHNILRTRRVTVVAGHVHKSQAADLHGVDILTVRSALARGGPAGFAVVDAGPEEMAAFEVAVGAAPVRFAGLKAERRLPPPEIAPAPPRLPGRTVWKAELETRLHAGPVFDGGRLFAAGHDGRLTCLNEGGRVLWVFRAAASFISRPAADGGSVYAASADGRVVRLEAATGRLQAAARLDFRPTSHLAVVREVPSARPILLAGGAAGRLAALDAERLGTLWTSGAASGLIQTRPLLASGRVVFGAWDGRLHAVEPRTGGPVWVWSDAGSFYYSPAGCSPAASAGNVYVCSPDGFVTAVRLESGAAVWRTRLTAWESLGLSADGRRVLVKGRTDEFAVLDASDGAILRRVAPAHGGDLLPSEPLEWRGRILFGARDGRVYSLKPSGPAEAVVDLGPGGVLAVLPLGDDRLAAADCDGRIVVFRLSE